MEPRFKATGNNGQIELYENFIMVTRNNIPGGRFVFLHALSGVEFRLPHNKQSGFLKLFAPGFDEFHTSMVLEVDRHANRVMFGTKELDEFKALLDILLKEIKPPSCK